MTLGGTSTSGGIFVSRENTWRVSTGTKQVLLLIAHIEIPVVANVLNLRVSEIVIDFVEL